MDAMQRLALTLSLPMMIEAANGVDMNAYGLRPMSFHAAPKQYKKPDTLTDEDLQHNAEVEKKKAAKRARKEARKQ